MKWNGWQRGLKVVDGGVKHIGQYGITSVGHTTMRPATFWEKVRFCIGLPYKGPQWLEIRRDK
jgi:hypothetical protein